MRVHRAVLAVLLTTALAAVGCSGEGNKGEGDGGSGREDAGTVRVGASLELSGPTASIGTAYKKALELQVAELNRTQALGAGRKLQLVVRDNKTNPDLSVANIDELVHKEKVAAIVAGGCSACVIPAADTINKGKVPTIALASAAQVTEPVGQRRYLFKVSPTPGQDAAVLLAALKERGADRIGLLTVDNVYGKGGRSAVTYLAADHGIEIVGKETFAQTDQDMSAQVGRLVEKRPDAIVVWSVMPAAGVITKDIKQSGFRGGTYLDAGAGAELFVNGVGAAAEDVHMVFPRVLAVGDVTEKSAAVERQKEWVRDYTEAYGAYSGFSSFAADALQIIADAVRTTGTTDGGKLRDAIEKTRIDGLSGPIAMGANDHSGLRPESLAILRVSDGEWHLD